MKKKKSPKKLKSWADLKKKRFQKDPEEAIAYLKASFGRKRRHTGNRY